MLCKLLHPRCLVKADASPMDWDLGQVNAAALAVFGAGAFHHTVSCPMFGRLAALFYCAGGFGG